MAQLNATDLLKDAGRTRDIPCILKTKHERELLHWAL